MVETGEHLLQGHDGSTLALILFLILYPQGDLDHKCCQVVRVDYAFMVDYDKEKRQVVLDVAVQNILVPEV